MAKKAKRRSQPPGAPASRPQNEQSPVRSAREEGPQDGQDEADLAPGRHARPGEATKKQAKAHRESPAG